MTISGKKLEAIALLRGFAHSWLTNDDNDLATALFHPAVLEAIDEARDDVIQGTALQAGTVGNNKVIYTQEAIENATKEYNEKYPDSDTKYFMKDGNLWATVVVKDKEFIKKVIGQGPRCSMSARFDTGDLKNSLAIARMDIEQAIDDQITLREKLDSILVFIRKAEATFSTKKD